MNIYFKSGIIIFVIILFIFLFFIFKPHNIDPSPSTNTCKDDLISCGTGCYDKKWQSCDKDKQICDLQNFSQENNKCCISPENLHNKIQIDDKGNTKIVGSACCKDEYWSSVGNTCCSKPVCGGFCCENTLYCNYDIVDDNKKNNKNNNPCTKCEYNLCGQNCCLINEKCFTGPSGNISCCIPELWDPDTKICCNGSTGAKVGIDCNTGGKSKCTNPICNDQQTCIAENKCCDNIHDTNNNLYKCVDQNLNPICCKIDDIKNNKCQQLKNGNYICCDNNFTLDENSQRCFQICGDNKCDPKIYNCVGSDSYQYCQTKGCIWDSNSVYNPPDFGGKIIFSYNKPGDNTTKYYFAEPENADIGTSLKRTLTYSEIDKDNKCTIDDCTKKISEEGASSEFHIDTHKCIGTYNHSNVKDFPSIKSNPTCPYDTSCVMENNNLTGQICLNSKGLPQKAYNGNVNNIFNMQIGDCICNNGESPNIDNCKIYDDSLCSNHGTPNETTGKCDCRGDSHFIGDICKYSRNTTCSGHGNVSNDGKCFCDLGFSGTNCSTREKINIIISVKGTNYPAILDPNSNQIYFNPPISSVKSNQIFFQENTPIYGNIKLNGFGSDDDFLGNFDSTGYYNYDKNTNRYLNTIYYDDGSSSSFPNVYITKV